MRILFVTGSRGEWGYIRPLLNLCKKEGIDYNICATNMHLIPDNGLSVNEIKNDGFEVTDEVYMSLEGRNHFSMSKSLGVLQMSLTDIVQRLKPDWMLLAGDRGEQLVASIVGAYTYTPVAHIQAGELSGNIDGITRHALGKFAHIHFAANADAEQRLVKLGEEPFRVFNVGAPQLDELACSQFTDVDELSKKMEIDLLEPFLLVVQHPVTEEYEKADEQVSCTIEALKKVKMKKVWILPNNDAGSFNLQQRIIKERTSDIFLYANLKREDYLGLLKNCLSIVGNSSSGLLEAPTFATPAVNIGRRQNLRVQGENVINCGFDVEDIYNSILKASSDEFRSSISKMKNPYGDGKSSERILEVLKTTKLDSKLLNKQLTY